MRHSEEASQAPSSAAQASPQTSAAAPTELAPQRSKNRRGLLVAIGYRTSRTVTA
jgi:hypothetical protein